MRKCSANPAYFIHNYVMILNATDELWRPFRLWPAQRDVLKLMDTHFQLVILKARQLGLTWLCLGFVLWRMIFHPVATVGIFSRRELDSEELLDTRLKGMFTRLPDWMRQGIFVMENNKTRWRLSNGSTAMAFPTNGGRQYTFSHVMVDEADFQPDLPGLLTAVKPTIDAGGRMWLVSSPNKDLPKSRFKIIYRAAKSGDTEWRAIFLPWHARPSRTVDWYETQKRHSMMTTGYLDDLAQEYPATDSEALAPRSADKRIAAVWIEACFDERMPLDVLPPAAPSIVGLEVYHLPEEGKAYVIGADPAEGNPNSDDSALTVVEKLTGVECAVLAGKFEPTIFGGHINDIAVWYNHAGVMIERNNHGHAVIRHARDHSQHEILVGHDGRPGWLSNALGKKLLYSATADHFRHNASLEAPEYAVKVLHSAASYEQLSSIDGRTLLAPPNQHDDRADSYALAQVGRAADPEANLTVIRQAAALYGTRDRQEPEPTPYRSPNRAPRGDGGLYGSRR